MNVDYINPFINASINVFTAFAGIVSTPGPPAIITRLLKTGYLNGFIGLNGHGINGYFIINFSEFFLRKVYSNLFDTDELATQEQLYDIAGELTNMISGSAKAQLSGKGFFFDMNVPKISHTVPKVTGILKHIPIITVPFKTDSGCFAIEASILRIEEDFEVDTHPEIEPPAGMISVKEFSRRSGMAKVKVRRFLKTGFIEGRKISNAQWHISEGQLEKIQGKKQQIHLDKSKQVKLVNSDSIGESLTIEKFAMLSNLSQIKIKRFLKTGFLKGVLDETDTWQIPIMEISKFRQ
jgi:chemotaxis protein CheX